MGYNISNSYHWYRVPKEPDCVAKIYYIEKIPFDLDRIENPTPEIIQLANQNKGVNADDLFKKSDYLIAEMLHPLLFELEIDNPEEMPDDYEIIQS